LAKGLDDLVLGGLGVDEKGNPIMAETTRKGENGRLIQMTDQGNVNNNAIQLQHEAYRDGYVNADNKSETRQAVLAHTQMADRMRADKLTFNKSGSVGLELALYDYAMQTGDWSAFDRYVDENYDSSADFWKVIVKNDGTYKMQDDQSDDITVVTEINGKEVQLAFFQYQGDSRTKFIGETLDLSREEVNYIMGTEYGWTYENETWTNDGKTDGVVRFGDKVSERISLPLSEQQRSLVEEIIGTTFNGKVFDYSSVRISYRKTPEQTLRDEIARMSNANGEISKMLSGMAQSQINTMIQDTVKSDRPFSLPNGVIYFPLEEYKVNALFNETMATLTHEVFHQFQYMDMGISNAFKELLKEQVLYNGGKGTDVYDYKTNNNVGGINKIITSLNDIKYYEGKANFIEDFARYYLRNKGSNPPSNKASNNNLINQRAEALSKSGLISRAISYAMTWK
jgi:hypothetical protein